MPLRVVALDGIVTSIVTGQLRLVGRLGYDEKDGKGTIVFFPTKVGPVPSDGELRNNVNLTLRAKNPIDIMHCCRVIFPADLVHLSSYRVENFPFAGWSRREIHAGMGNQPRSAHGFAYGVLPTAAPNRKRSHGFVPTKINMDGPSARSMAYSSNPPGNRA
jgi:hypothetical protein